MQITRNSKTDQIDTRIDLIEVARQACGMSPVMECADEAKALAGELRQRTKERDAWAQHCQRAEEYAANLLAERDFARKERDAMHDHYMRVQSELDTLRTVNEMNGGMRELVGELRKIYRLTEPGEAERLLRALLRKIDLESQL